MLTNLPFQTEMPASLGHTARRANQFRYSTFALPGAQSKATSWLAREFARTRISRFSEAELHFIPCQRQDPLLDLTDSRAIQMEVVDDLRLPRSSDTRESLHPQLIPKRHGRHIPRGLALARSAELCGKSHS